MNPSFIANFTSRTMTKSTPSQIQQCASVLLSRAGKIAVLSTAIAAYASPSAQALLLQTNSLSINATGTLDLKNNQIILYAPNGGQQATNATNVEGWVNTGFNFFGNNGFGINSSTAAADPNSITTVGVVNNNDAFFASYAGVNLTGTDQVFAQYTYFGDANLSGTVDSDDVSLFDTGFTSGGALNTWYYGDFDHDGDVDAEDVSLLDAGFFGSNPNPPGTVAPFVGGSYTPAFAGGAVAAAVPEPVSGLLLVLGGVAVAACQRKRFRSL